MRTLILTSLGWNELCVAGTGTSRKAMEVLPFIPLGAVGSAEPGSGGVGVGTAALLNSTNETTSTDPVSWKRVVAVALPSCCQQRERKEKGRKERKGGKERKTKENENET